MKSSTSQANDAYGVVKPKFFGKFVAAVAGLTLLSLTVIAASPASGIIKATDSQALKWTGTASATGAAQGELTCVEGVNCDSFSLTVGGSTASWANAILKIKLDWTIPANDYDLYVHKGGLTGPIVASSATGAPSTEEGPVFIDPVASGTGQYTVHAVYFTTTPNDQYIGSAQVIARPVSPNRAALYVDGGLAFSPNQTVAAAVTDSDGEPSSRTDYLGNHYVMGIRGVPAGIDLWYFDLRPNSPTFDPYMRNPIYRGQPDAFSPQQAVSVGADGGGDVDLAVGFGPAGPNNVPTISASSLTAANISVYRSQDLGNSWTKNPLGNAPTGAAVDDRQWHAFFGSSTVYMLYRTFQPAVAQIQCSHDGGVTFGPSRTAGTIGQAGSIDVDQNDGTVYVAGSSGIVAVGIPDPILKEPTTYTNYQVVTDPGGAGNLFFLVRVAPDGTCYACYSNGQHIFLMDTKDKGAHWTPPVQVDHGDFSRTALLPSLVVGPKMGSVAVGWYATNRPVNDDAAMWRVLVAQSFDADSSLPTFRQSFASDHVIHGSNISLGGTLGNANRNLLDYFQMSYDPMGALVVDYTDDHNDFNGNVFVTRQIGGQNNQGVKLPAVQEGAELPPRQWYSQTNSLVLDPPNDVAYGLLAVLPFSDPLDITSIKYSSSQLPNQDYQLKATMTVSNLSTIPPVSNWRMNFTFNCPYDADGIGHTFSNGVSDLGDQFYLKAMTDAQGKQSFVFGTAVRDSTGSITSTDQGPADGGRFDTTNNTISVWIAAAKLTPFMKHGKPVGYKSIASGLRGSTWQESGDAKRDATRGGRVWIIGIP